MHCRRGACARCFRGAVARAATAAVVGVRSADRAQRAGFADHSVDARWAAGTTLAGTAAFSADAESSTEPPVHEQRAAPGDARAAQDDACAASDDQ